MNDEPQITIKPYDQGMLEIKLWSITSAMGLNAYPDRRTLKYRGDQILIERDDSITGSFAYRIERDDSITGSFAYRVWKTDGEEMRPVYRRRMGVSSPHLYIPGKWESTIDDLSARVPDSRIRLTSQMERQGRYIIRMADAKVGFLEKNFQKSPRGWTLVRQHDGERASPAVLQRFRSLSQSREALANIDNIRDRLCAFRIPDSDGYAAQSLSQNSVIITHRGERIGEVSCTAYNSRGVATGYLDRTGARQVTSSMEDAIKWIKKTDARQAQGEPDMTNHPTSDCPPSHFSSGAVCEFCGCTVCDSPDCNTDDHDAIICRRDSGTPQRTRSAPTAPSGRPRPQQSAQRAMRSLLSARIRPRPPGEPTEERWPESDWPKERYHSSRYLRGPRRIRNRPQRTFGHAQSLDPRRALCPKSDANDRARPAVRLNRGGRRRMPRGAVHLEALRRRGRMTAPKPARKDSSDRSIQTRRRQCP